MSVSQEHRYQALVAERLNTVNAAEREHQIVVNDAAGIYAPVKAADETRLTLDGALLKWAAPRPEMDYRTKAEAVRVAKAMGPDCLPVRAFTPFESFWVVANVRCLDGFTVEGVTYRYRPATDAEALQWRATMNRTSAALPLYVVSK